jgi:hypothetical protein
VSQRWMRNAPKEVFSIRIEFSGPRGPDAIRKALGRQDCRQKLAIRSLNPQDLQLILLASLLSAPPAITSRHLGLFHPW